MNVIRRWYRAPAAAGTSVDSALRGRWLWLERNAVGDRRIVQAMVDAREAEIGKHQSSGWESGARGRAVTMATTIGVRWGIAPAIAFTSHVVAGEFAHDILTVMACAIMAFAIMAVLITLLVMAVMAVGTWFADHMLVVTSDRQMQVNSERRRQRRQDRHCDEQMASAGNEDVGHAVHGGYMPSTRVFVNPY